MSDSAYDIEALIEAQKTYIGHIESLTISDTSVLLLAPDTKRKGFIIFNPSGICYVALNVTAAINLFTYRLTSNCTLEIDHYNGCVSAVRDTGQSGEIILTEKV